MRLSDLKTGEAGVITEVKGTGAFRRRIIEMGFITGNRIEVIKNAPLEDPIEYSLLNYRISLRRSEARLIEVQKNGEPRQNITWDSHPEPGHHLFDNPSPKGREIKVAFVGNPNAGKTSVFNYATRSREKTGNYAGVTVDSKTSTIVAGQYILHLTDLPGTYSLSPYSPEEIFVRRYITEEKPDIIVNVVDASNLERNLYLTTQLIDMEAKIVLALNMYDELVKSRDKLNTGSLEKLLGIPIVPTIGSKGKGIKNLLRKVIQVYNRNEEVPAHKQVHFGEDVEGSVRKIRQYIEIPGNRSLTVSIPSRYLAIKLLEQDKPALSYLELATNKDSILECVTKEVHNLERLLGEDIISFLAGKRYGYIEGALMETYHRNRNYRIKTTKIIDGILTSKLLGFPFFIFFLWLMFTLTFKLGDYPHMLIENGISALSVWISKYMADGSMKDLLINGIIGGVGGVIVFLPNIIILFVCISFMEDSGYMARAVFIMDRLMHRIGLHGKSFIPLIMGFGCNVPAIMTTRSIEDKNNRMVTMLINPFMSCSARLPVYILLIGAVFPSYKGSLLFLLYLTGILMAIIMALIFRHTLFRTQGTPFVMELPPYRMPTLRSVVKHMWSKSSQYLKKMGGVILAASIILWALGYFPRINDQTNITGKHSDIEYKSQAREYQLENSYIGRIGRFIEPVIRPLGFDWKMGVSLISGIAAKEIVVSTLGVLHHVDSEDHKTLDQLTERIRHDRYSTGPYAGQLVFNPLATLSFLLFILIYFPCIAVFAAIRKESASGGWALFTVVYTTVLAYMISFIVFQTGKFILNFI